MVVGHSSPFGWLNTFVNLFHMPFFFFASGFLFREKHLETPTKYVRRKFSGLWYPFFFWSLLYLFLHNLFACLHFYHEGYTFSQSILLVPRYLIMAGTEQLLGGFWFLSALLFATIIGYCYYKWIGFSSRAIITGIIILIIIAELLCFMGIYHQTVHLNSRDFMAAALFLSGTLYARLDGQITKKYRSVFISASVIFLALESIFIPAAIGSLTVQSVIPYFITSSISSIALIIVCHTLGRSSIGKILAKVGMRSIDILVFHFLAFKLVTLTYIIVTGDCISRLAEFPVLGHTNTWLWLIYTLVAVVVSYFLGYGISRLKAHYRMLSRLLP